LLEVGCGVGDDAKDIVALGFDYDGIDISGVATARASKSLKSEAANFFPEHFLTSHPAKKYSIIYDKGVFHNQQGTRYRELFARRVAQTLDEGGMWITVCGAAEYPGTPTFHPALYLTHLVRPIEPYFEILEIIKGQYGVRKPAQDFKAWFGLFRRWR